MKNIRILSENFQFLMVKFSIHLNKHDLSLCFQLTESVNIVVYADKQKMPRLDCTDAHADLDFRCSHMA